MIGDSGGSGTRREARDGTARAQANLVALALALLVVSTTAVIGVVVADGAIARADRDPGERRTAVALSERLVDADGPLTARANVLDGAAVDGLDGDRLRELFPVVGDRAVRVRLDDETVAATGDATGGTTVRRVVLVRRQSTASYEPALSAANNWSTTIPRRTPRATVRIDPPAGTTVTTVRANGRVVLHDPAGLDGTFDVRLSRFDTSTLRFDVEGDLPDGSVTVTHYPARTTKALLEVTVDD